MEGENKTIKVSFAAVLLIISIIVIAIMGYIIYNMYNKNIDATKEIENLNSQISTLENNIDGLQGKINNIANALNPNNQSTTLKLGKYTVDEVKLNEHGGSNKDCGVQLKENNKFEIYMGYSEWFLGEYEISNNKLICKATTKQWDTGEPGGLENRTTNITFTFDILSNNKLKLSNIEDNDTEYQTTIYEEALSVGMTYSIK